MTSPSRKPTVLLVEDDECIRDTLATLLRLEDIGSCGVCSGYEAAQALEQQLPDLVLSDLVMADGDGFWLIRHIRATPRLAGLPVVIVSARADAGTKQTVLEAGANAFVVKPFHPDHLLSVVRTHLPASAPDRSA